MTILRAADFSSLDDIAYQVKHHYRDNVTVDLGVGTTHVYNVADFGAVNNLRIVGHGNSSVIEDHGDGDSVVVGDGSVEVRNVLFENFLMTSPYKKTNGAAIHLRKAVRNRLMNVDVSSQENGMGFHDGIRMSGMDDSTIDDCNVYARHWGIVVHGLGNQSWGADLEIVGGTKIQNMLNTNGLEYLDATGIYCGGAMGGLYLERTHMIYCGTGMFVGQDIAKQQNREIFCNGTIIDSCLANGISLGDNCAGSFHFNSGWIASCGILTGGYPNGNGIWCSPAQLNDFQGIISDSDIFNHQGSGAIINGGRWKIADNVFRLNGRHTKGGRGLVVFKGAKDVMINNNVAFANGNATEGTGIWVDPYIGRAQIIGNQSYANGRVNYTLPTANGTRSVVNNSQ